jgi:branched-chain amino acid transport system substrate-binding protein
MTRYCLNSFAAALVVMFAISDARAEIRIGVAAPLTGPYAWSGDRVVRSSQAAVHDLNAAGGVLGQSLKQVIVDDFCDSDQAIAAANKLIEATVPVVIGHQCSGAAIPASSLYEGAGIILISPAATNPQLTDRGLRYTLRTGGRDDQQGTIAGDHLADAWGDRKIAIVHDGEAYGQGVAEEVRRRLQARGVTPTIFAAITPGKKDYIDLVMRLRTAGIDLVFYGGYQQEAGLIVRQAKERLDDIEFLLPDGVAGEDFWLIAGDAAEGIRMTTFAEVRGRPSAGAVVQRFRDDGYEPLGATLYTYAAVQAWAQAVEKAGTTEPAAVLPVLRNQTFDTVLGHLGFDEKGDVTGIDTFDWFVWTNGEYVPMDEKSPKTN